MQMGIDRRKHAHDRPGPPPAAPAAVRAPKPARADLVHGRTCVGCRVAGEQDGLMRLISDEDGRVAIDPRARGGGRGAWVHATRSCIVAAVKRHAAERTLKVDVQKDLDAAVLLTDLRMALVRKAESLMLVAARTRHVAVGAEAVAGALEAGKVSLLIVATDAGESSRALAAEGGDGEGGPKVVRFQQKTELGRLFHRAEVALVALMDHRLATELASTIDRLAVLEDR